MERGVHMLYDVSVKAFCCCQSLTHFRVSGAGSELRKICAVRTIRSECLAPPCNPDSCHRARQRGGAHDIASWAMRMMGPGVDGVSEPQAHPCNTLLRP